MQMINRDLIEEIKQTDWGKYSEQEYYKPKDVPQALINLIMLNDELLLGKVSSNLLFAIGNDHRGTYYPATIDAVKFISQTAVGGKTEVARQAAIEILILLYSTFYPELDDHNSLTRDELENKIHMSIESFKEKFEMRLKDSTESERNKKSLADLLGFIDEQAKQTDA